MKRKSKLKNFKEKEIEVPYDFVLNYPKTLNISKKGFYKDLAGERVLMLTEVVGCDNLKKKIYLEVIDSPDSKLRKLIENINKRLEKHRNKK